MVISTVPARFSINSVFGGRPLLTVKIENYSIVMKQIVRNLINIPFNISYESAEIHDEETLKVLQSANLRPEAKTALVSRIDLNDRNSSELKIIAMADVAAFFEVGVKQHPVVRKYTSVSGASVGEWMDSHGLEDASGFIVGAPGSIQARPGIRFMEKGFNKAVSKLPTVTDKHLRRI